MEKTMDVIEVNNEKCIRCGLCVKACPVYIISLNKGCPDVNKRMNALCINCGHCEAICPKEALRLTAELPENSYKGARTEFTKEQFGEYLRRRRSIRRFKENPVSKDIFAELLDMVRYAPSGSNLQPLEWIVVYDSEKVKKLAALTIEWMKDARDGKVSSPLPVYYFDFALKAWERGEDPILRKAPHVVLTYPHKASPINLIDSTIALTYFELSLPLYELGSCWAGFLQMALASSSELKKEIGVALDSNCLGAVMLGYPEYKYKGVPRREPLKVRWF